MPCHPAARMPRGARSRAGPAGRCGRYSASASRLAAAAAIAGSRAGPSARRRSAGRALVAPGATAEQTGSVDAERVQDAGRCARSPAAWRRAGGRRGALGQAADSTASCPAGSRSRLPSGRRRRAAQPRGGPLPHAADASPRPRAAGHHVPAAECCALTATEGRRGSAAGAKRRTHKSHRRGGVRRSGAVARASCRCGGARPCGSAGRTPARRRRGCRCHRTRSAGDPRSGPSPAGPGAPSASRGQTLPAAAVDVRRAERVAHVCAWTRKPSSLGCHRRPRQTRLPASRGKRPRPRRAHPS
jgi:hypothetical protein